MVGDPIFLIGKDEVRYYGLLSQVNEADRTITLEQARCLGTEGRLGNPAKEIPPSRTVFELIRFRADEVKHVEFVADSGNAAPPPPAAAAAAPAPQSQPAVNNAAVGGYRPVDVSVQNQQHQQPSSSYGASAAASGSDQHQAARSDGAGTYQPQGSGYQDGSERAAEGDGYQADYQQHQQRQGSGGYGRGGYGQQNQRGGRGGYNHRGNGTRRGGYQGRGGYQQQGNRYGQQNRRMEVPESDFDFETSNSKLNKNEVAKEFAKLNVKVSDRSEEAAVARTAGSAGGTWTTAAAASSNNNSGPSSGLAVADTYVPKKSFFDDISSEVKERMEMQDRGLSFEERRSRMNAERQQNYETFGQTSVDPNRLRYNRYNNSRGGYQGQGGQGGGWRGGRGGRGGYNYRGNNRGNYNAGHRSQNYQNQNQQTSAGANPSGGGGLVDSGAQA
ncbi:hypothetical protein IWW48_000070 [Coemansia sp. RSA 1200]|nr:hypothetical protein IWW48_000070 [Coemansia sp. RSA 1200]